MKNFFHIPNIIGTLPVTLTNGTTADATQVMSDLNFIVNQVNANAATLANTALTNVNNNFTAVQSGQNATASANFPTAGQVQNQVFNTLSSTLGTNAITARCAQLPLAAYAVGQIFRWIPSQKNTGPANITVDAAGSTIIFSGGSTLVGGEMIPLIPAVGYHDGARVNLLNPAFQRMGFYSMTLGADVALNNTGQFFDGPSVAQGTLGTWLVIGTVTVRDTTGASNFDFILNDGAVVFASGREASFGVNNDITVTLVAIVTNPAGNLRMSAKDESTVSGVMKFNASGNSTDSKIVAIRIG